MQKKNKPKLDRFQEQARSIISLYFNPTTPAFVRDLVSSWLTRLESETQIFWNRREVLTVALPMMLREADHCGLDVFSPGSPLCLEAFQESIGVYETAERHEREPSEAELLRCELEQDAEAIARILNSPHTPANIKHTLAELILEMTDDLNEAPEVLRVQYPLAILAQMKEAKR